MPCLHGGKCINLNTEGSGSGESGLVTREVSVKPLHMCVCQSGYTGKLCETGN